MSEQASADNLRNRKEIQRMTNLQMTTQEETRQARIVCLLDFTEKCSAHFWQKRIIIK